MVERAKWLEAQWSRGQVQKPLGELELAATLRKQHGRHMQQALNRH